MSALFSRYFNAQFWLFQARRAMPILSTASRCPIPNRRPQNTVTAKAVFLHTRIIVLPKWHTLLNMAQIGSSMCTHGDVHSRPVRLGRWVETYSNCSYERRDRGGCPVVLRSFGSP